jgi:hypothetical protein
MCSCVELRDIARPGYRTYQQFAEELQYFFCTNTHEHDKGAISEEEAEGREREEASVGTLLPISHDDVALYGMDALNSLLASTMTTLPRYIIEKEEGGEGKRE